MEEAKTDALEMAAQANQETEKAAKEGCGRLSESFINGPQLIHLPFYRGFQTWV